MWKALQYVFAVCFPRGSEDICAWRRLKCSLGVFVLPRQSSMESPNLEFEYGDTDALIAELSGTADGRKRAN